MKLLLSPSGYTFSASAKTITFSGTIPVDISQILHVSNITRGVLYFQPQAGNLFTGTYNSPTLTLAASTTGHSDSDKLLIFYDDGTIYSRGGGALDGNTQRVTLASDGPGVAALASLDAKTPALVNGRQPVVSEFAARSAVTTSIAASLTSVAIVAANANRKGIILSNTSSGTWTLSIGATATAANSFLFVLTNERIVLEPTDPVTLQLSGFCSVASGTLQVTELT